MSFHNDSSKSSISMHEILDVERLAYRSGSVVAIGILVAKGFAELQRIERRLQLA